MLSIILRNGAVGFFSLEGKLKTSEMQQRNVILLKEVGKKVHISIIIEFSLLNVRSDLVSNDEQKLTSPSQEDR